MSKKKVKEKRDPATDKGTIVLPEIRFEDATGVKDVRHYLNDPYLDLRGKVPVLVATNGHVMIAVECKIDGNVTQGSLGLEAIQRCRKDAGKYNDPVLHFDGKMHGTGKAMFERPNWPDEVNYPDWRKVNPEIEQKQKPDVAFNGDYLKLLADAVNGKRKSSISSNGVGLILGKDEKAKTKVKPIDNRKAISVRGTGTSVLDQTYFAVLMPMRFD